MKKLNLKELELKLPKIDENFSKILLGGDSYGEYGDRNEQNSGPTGPLYDPSDPPKGPFDYDNQHDLDTSLDGYDQEQEGNWQDDYWDHDNVDNTDSESEWELQDFFDHYSNGDGQPVDLNDIGLRDDVKDSDTYLQMMTNINDQIEQYVHDQIANNGNPEVGVPVSFSWDFNNSYDFTLDEDLFAIGSATIGGEFIGEYSIDENGEINVSGIIDINFHDVFEDPWDLFNSFEGSWDPNGTPFEINDDWQEQISMWNIVP